MAVIISIKKFENIIWFIWKENIYPGTRRIPITTSVYREGNFGGEKTLCVLMSAVSE